MAKHDVFIAHPANSWRWVEDFEVDLKEKLDALRPEGEIAVHLPRRGWSLGCTSDDTLQEARQSVIFLAILAPSVRTSYDDRVFFREWKAFKESYDMFGPAGNRTVLVCLEDTSRQCINRYFNLAEHEDAFQISFQFHFKDDLGTTHTLARDSHGCAYRRKIAELASYLEGRLDRIKQRVFSRDQR